MCQKPRPTAKSSSIFLAETLLTPMGHGRYFVGLRKAYPLVKLVNRLGGSRGGSITIPINMGVVSGNTKS